MDDALAVLDARDVERAWAIGHSWGGHLALHLLVAHPERLLGVIAVDPLGAFDVFEEQGRRMQRRLSADEIARVDEIEELRSVGNVTDDELVERWGLLWPQFFLHEELASAPPQHVGPQCSIGTNASIFTHFEQRTLELGLPDARLPVLIVHGVQSPLTVESAERTAALVPGAVFEPIDDVRALPVDRAAGRRPPRGRAVSLALRRSTSPYNRSLHLADRNAPRTGGDRGDPRPGRVGLRRLGRRRPGASVPSPTTTTAPTTTGEAFEGATGPVTATAPDLRDRAARARGRRRPRRLRPRRLPVPERAPRLPGRVRRSPAPRGRLRQRRPAGRRGVRGRSDGAGVGLRPLGPGG